MPYVVYSDSNDLGESTVGQVEDMQELIKVENPQTDIEAIQLYPKICAIYLQPIMLFEKYDYKKALKYAETVEKEIDFKTVINMGAFFFKRLHDLLTGLSHNAPKTNRLKKKLKRAYGNLVQRLDSMLH
jgi:hypothetical protein